MSLSVDKLSKISLTFATSSTTASSAAIPAGHSGWIKTTLVTMPSMSAASISGTLHLFNSDGDRIQISSSNVFSAAATTTVSGMEWPIEGNDTIQLRLSGIPGSAAGVSATPSTANVTLYLVP